MFYLLLYLFYPLIILLMGFLFHSSTLFGASGWLTVLPLWLTSLFNVLLLIKIRSKRIAIMWFILSLTFGLIIIVYSFYYGAIYSKGFLVYEWDGFLWINIFFYLSIFQYIFVIFSFIYVFIRKIKISSLYFIYVGISLFMPIFAYFVIYFSR